VGYVVNQYQRGTAALARIFEVLDTPISPRYRSTASPTAPEVTSGAVEFRDLTFTYGPGQSQVLKNVSLQISAGQSCGIVGETGSGKTTLVSLLLRLFEPPDGTVFVDGHDIKRLPIAEVEAAVGLVSQDIFLFSGTIRDNIAFGVDNGDASKAHEAARVAQLLPAVEAFTHQFQTVIGERGVRLSGGQKQRTALARAIIKNPPILILDDAFSSVDVETEENILRELKGFMQGRTTLLISHRISTVRSADVIVYLRSGKILERGTHDELLARRGAYFELYQRQRLAREVESINHQQEERA